MLLVQISHKRYFSAKEYNIAPDARISGQHDQAKPGNYWVWCGRKFVFVLLNMYC